MTRKKLGIAGKISENFINSKLTIIIVFFSVFLGVIPVWFTPKEEEPQISVPMIDIQTYSANFEDGEDVNATSMIGFIAGAGIIVRNSIILIDFIENQLKEGVSLKEAVIHSGVTRFRPMLLTAAAVVVGSGVILFDPIFQGLAISLMFGEIAATILSFFAIPVLYFWFIGKIRVTFLQRNNREIHNEN